MATTPLPFPHKLTGSVGPGAPLPVGAMVAHLTIERVLHEGDHTMVYLVRDPSGEALALMEYFPRAIALRQPDGAVRARQPGDAIAMSVGREAFVADANTLERVRHPGLVRVLGSLQAHRTVYRAMPFVDGITLERHIATQGAAPSALAVVRLLDQLLDSLEALHLGGVVHGCVRPDQILVAAGGATVLLGMGSAGAEISGHEAGPWSAPEQSAMSRHDRITTATDLYMAALTVWSHAAGKPPPALRDRLSAPEDWNPLDALATLPEGSGAPAGMRQRLADVLSACLATRPADRPQRVADVRALLHPGPVGAGFEPSGAVPLWVGVMPDRESQWQVLEQEIARGPRHSTDAGGALSSAGASDARMSSVIRTRETGERAPNIPASRWAWGGALAATVLAAIVGGTMAIRQNAEKRDLSRFDVTATVPAGAVEAASAAATGLPGAACAGMAQAELRQCLQQQCDRSLWRDHVQCVNLRRQGDIR